MNISAATVSNMLCDTIISKQTNLSRSDRKPIQYNTVGSVADSKVKKALKGVISG